MSLPRLFKNINSRVKDTGDIITGNLTLSTPSSTTYFGQNTTTNREFYIETTSDSYTVIANRPIGGGVGKRTALWLAPETVEDDKLFRLVVNKDDNQVIYPILHAGNYKNYTSKIQGLERLTADTVDSFIEGDIFKWAKCNADVVGNDGMIMSLGWSSGFGAQIWVDDGGNEGGMKFRSAKGLNSEGKCIWDPWRQVLTENNYENIVKDKFLPLTGGIMTGLTSFTENKVVLNFRPNNADYQTTISYQTTGNEAMVFATKQNLTSFIFVNGEDSITNVKADRWRSLTPGLQIKYNSVYVGELIGDGTNPNFKFKVHGTSCFDGGLFRVNGNPIFGYRYSQSSNAPAFVWDKSGANYTGMGANGVSDTIYFGAVYSSDFTWNNDYKQKWLFNGACNSVVNTDYSTIRFRSVGAGTSSAPSSLGNGEMWVMY